MKFLTNMTDLKKVEEMWVKHATREEVAKALKMSLDMLKYCQRKLRKMGKELPSKRSKYYYSPTQK